MAEEFDRREAERAYQVSGKKGGGVQSVNINFADYTLGQGVWVRGEQEREVEHGPGLRPY